MGEGRFEGRPPLDASPLSVAALAGPGEGQGRARRNLTATPKGHPHAHETSQMLHLARSSPTGAAPSGCAARRRLAPPELGARLLAAAHRLVDEHVEQQVEPIARRHTDAVCAARGGGGRRGVDESLCPLLLALKGSSSTELYFGWASTRVHTYKPGYQAPAGPYLLSTLLPLPSAALWPRLSVKIRYSAGQRPPFSPPAAG
jgi:hypothetical protein